MNKAGYEAQTEAVKEKIAQEDLQHALDKQRTASAEEMKQARLARPHVTIPDRERITRTQVNNGYFDDTELDDYTFESMGLDETERDYVIGLMKDRKKQMKLEWAETPPNEPREFGEIAKVYDSEVIASSMIEGEVPDTIQFSNFLIDGSVDDEALKIIRTKAKKQLDEARAKLYKTKVKKVAIVGTAMTYKNAPYDDPSWEIWGLNDHWNNLPRATRWFEANNAACRIAKVSHKPDMLRVDWLKKCPIPVYMEEHYDDIPMSVKYPYDEVNDFICDLDESGRDYFTNSVSFMIALAIYEGFDEISLYGVDMAVGSEYEKQRPSCEFWVGLAKGRGIKVYIPDNSDLLKTMVVYGRSTKIEPFIMKMNDRKAFQEGQVANINAEIAKAQNNIQQLTATKFQYQGSLADIDQTLKVWGML